MYVGLNPGYAQIIANNVDYNRNGVIERKELTFKQNAKRLADFNRDGRVSTEELAWSLSRGDIYISGDRKAYPAYGYHKPPYGAPAYPPYPQHPYLPPYGNQPPYPTAPGYPYNRPSTYSPVASGLATTVVGAGLGAGVAYAVGGSVGVGAAIGGALGLLGALVD